MNKSEIVESLRIRGAPVHSEWTLPEVRQILMEIYQEEKPKTVANEAMKGISKATLEDLIQRARTLNVSLPPKPTRGWLIRALRDATDTPAETLVTFGKFKGWMFKEVPQQYLDWSIAEVDGNVNASEELRLLANWARQQVDKPKANPRTRSLATDPEALAKIPPPSVRDMYDGPSGSDASWSAVSSSTTGRRGHAAKAAPKKMMSEEEEINLLESRLSMLKERQKQSGVMTVDD